MLRDVNIMVYLSKLFLQWIISGKKERLCMSVLQEGNSKSSYIKELLVTVRSDLVDVAVEGL